MNTPTHITWIGICAGTKILGLFDADLTCEIRAEFNEGDIVQVDSSLTPHIDPTIKLIAPINSARYRIYQLLAKYEMNPIHPAESLREAESFSIAQALNDPALLDFTDLDFVTIDNEDSKDLDQAVYIDHDEKSGFCIYYALADAAWFVRPGTGLHREASKRGVTYYAPQLAVTMLPPRLSEDLISLNPDVERRALVFCLHLDHQGRLQKTVVERAKIKSRAKLSYNGVQGYFDATAEKHSHPYSTYSWVNSVKLLKTVGELLIADSEARDVIEYNRSAATVSMDVRNDNQFQVTVRQRNAVEKYNEQVSLLCNTAGAKLLENLTQSRPELQAIYRIHLPPLSARMRDFKVRLNALITERKLGPDWQWQSDVALADYVRKLPNSNHNHRIRSAIERMIMLTNRASVYSPEADIHHALGVSAYARFSSPMREMVGIFTHKELLEALDKETDRNIQLDSQLRESIIENANESKKRQRKLEKACQLLALDDFLKSDLEQPQDLRPCRKGTVMGVRDRKFYVLLDDFALDVKIYLSDIEDHYGCTYDTNDVSVFPTTTKSSAPAFVVGDEVSVRTKAWQETRNRYIFSVMKE